MRDLRRSPAALALLCAAVALVVHLAALRNGFAYDDVPAILGDPRVTAGDLPATLLTEPYWSARGEELGIWRPAVTLSYAIDWLVSGGSAVWYHAANLLWHALATALATLLLLRLFPPLAAAAGGLLFAVHPVHAEAVANVVGRAEPMAAAAVFAAGLLWLRGGRLAAAGVAALYAFGLAAKESAVMLPALLVLLDLGVARLRWEPESARRWLRERGAALAALAVVLVLYAAARLAVLGGAAPGLPHPAAEAATGPLDRLQTALQVWPQYTRLLLFPRVLLADYSPRVLMPAEQWSAAAVLGATLLIAFVGGGLIAARAGRGRTALGLLWLPVAILPVSNLLVTIGTLLAERTLYLPSFALAIAVAAAWQRAARIREEGLPRRGAAVAATVLLAITLFALRTIERVPEWRSTASIFDAVERDAPESFRVGWYRAREARQTQGAVQAVPHFARAIELWPSRRGLVLEAAGNAVEAGNLREARRLALRLIAIAPDEVEGHRMLAAVSLDLGDRATARRAVARGLAITPEEPLLLRMRDALTGATPADTAAASPSPTQP